MNDHAEMTAVMSLALDGMLTAGEMGALEAHLESCRTCSAEWARWKQIDALLTAEPAAAPSEQFNARVMARVKAKEDRRRRLTRRAWLVGGSLYIWAVGALVVGLAALMWVLSDPSVAVVVARVFTRMLSAAGVLVRTVSGLMRREVVAAVVSYACLVAATLAMWLRMARRKATPNAAPYARG